MSAPGDQLLGYLIPPPSHRAPRSLICSSPPVPPSLDGRCYSYSVHYGYESTAAGNSTLVIGTEDALRSRMEIETPRHPGDGPTDLAVSDAMGALDKVYSMDAFLAANPRPASPRAVPPQSKKAKTATSVDPTSASLPKPVAVGARSSKNTIALNEKLQSLGVPRPIFVFEGGSMDGWSIKVTFRGEELEEQGPFNSKQEAKETIGGQLLDVIERLEKEGKISKPEKGKKTKSATNEAGSSVPVQVEKEKKEPGENYIGRILEFQRARSCPQPTYTDYQLGTSFSCQITIEGEPGPFGSQNSLFSSKKAARQDAARCAVEHFKAANLWPSDVTSLGGIKKKKTQNKALVPSPSSPTRAHNESGTGLESPGTSYASRVATLAAQLSLATPEWRFHEQPSSDGGPATTGFHTVSCFFKNGGSHEGPIGTVRHIFGKKKAKEECARLTLVYLLEVRERRVSYGRKMMQGVMGGEEAVCVGVGAAVDGEEQRAKEAQKVVEEMSDGEFEDAMEDLVSSV